MSDKKPPLSKFQSFVYEEIPRAQIEMAHYNPRRITEGNRKRLSKALTTHGLVEPLVLNRRTMRLVSGHQRLTDLDSKHHGSNYSIGLAIVDVDEATEVKLNVLLNNQSTQGVFDIDAVAGLSKTFNIDLLDLGFSREDLLIDFNLDLKTPQIQVPGMQAPAGTPIHTEGSPGIFPPEEPVGPPVDPQRTLMQAKFDARKEKGYESSAGGTFQQFEDDYRITVVFENGKERNEFLASLGLEPDTAIVPASKIKPNQE